MRALILFPVIALAQPPVAPATEPVGPRRGEEVFGYRVQNSFEAGYRALTGHGNLDQYRSDVNFGNGVRLFSSSLRVNSKDGRGGWFDEIVLSTRGLGNDPYQFSQWRVEKNRWYRYDGMWRSNAYFNPALPVSGGQHLLDTNRRMQDHDLTLLPQSAFRVFAGFSRNSQAGPALSTVQLFDSRGDEFPLLANVRRRQNEYRFGNELRVYGVKLNWMRTWEKYAEDSWELQEAPLPGNNPSDRTTLARLARQSPYTGSTPSWRVNLFREQGRWWAVNGRFTHAQGRRGFAVDETAAGTDRLGFTRTPQTIVRGSANRPSTTAQATLSLFPAPSVTVANHTFFQNTRMEGDATYRQVENGSLNDSFVTFQYLGIRNVTNATDAQWRLRKWITVRGGYQYANRRIRSRETLRLEGFADGVEGDQRNRLHAGMAGVQFRPVRGLLVQMDGELGRNDRPFYPVSEKNYHGLNARALYRTPSLTLNVQAKANYNFNSSSLFSHAARVRQYSADGSWTPRAGLAVEAGYARLHTDTLTGLAFFASSQLVEGMRSAYASNLHTAHAGLHLSLAGRIDLFAGYTHAQDTGASTLPDPGVPVLRAAQTYPMRYLSPSGRVSVRLSEKIRWNAGYQHYGYHDQQLTQLTYGAHTAYTSVLWSF